MSNDTELLNPQVHAIWVADQGGLWGLEMGGHCFSAVRREWFSAISLSSLDRSRRVTVLGNATTLAALIGSLEEKSADPATISLYGGSLFGEFNKAAFKRTLKDVKKFDRLFPDGRIPENSPERRKLATGDIAARLDRLTGPGGLDL
ncbi:MAG: hypothetical protein EOM26_01820 [Alphaproteobacteria bacterium]|nr:hypothetical protein [Alphaproteobacteria bacterium]